MNARPDPFGRTVGALVAGILYLVIAGGGEANDAAPTSDPRRALVGALAAPGPHSSLGDEARLFGRFVGTWDCAYSFYADDGSVRHASGELRFGWTLDGRAVQDLWISYPDETASERTIGTTVRFFDPKAGTWRVIFVAPTVPAVTTLQGGLEGDRIVLRGTNVNGAPIRWSFNDLRADSFTWRGEKSVDGGKTWRLREEHRMTRRSRGGTDMIEELGASGAHPSLARESALFDRFVGAWNVESVYHAADGKTSGFTGKWIFGWALDGRLMQDVLIEGDARSGHRRGTTVRFYDAKAAQWRVVWIPPASGNVVVLGGGAQGDRIVLEGRESGGALLRWSFNDVRGDSFLWRGETSADDGRTWRLEQEMRLTRDSGSRRAAEVAPARLVDDPPLVAPTAALPDLELGSVGR